MAIVTPEESEAPDEKRLTSQPQETFTFLSLYSKH